ncbi:hypothetical protein OH76DRAFT_1555718 [Lentinus brumalis]|uniref:Uncharacterized protein n=1 Tax=Lentinus brumalis TaxID=2498619 RepID=A0A371DDE0_9APHY|nr:hypothetical protein OH76DRAFT_1555718 [Polyporus brumalis]
MATTETLAQHPPAMKVGGRRLSMSSRPKPAMPSPEAQKATLPTVDTPPDYPRPAPPGEQPPPHHQEEEVPRKKQGTGADDHERRLQESLYRKAEQNRPKKDFQSGPKNVGGGAHQPADC